MSNISDLNKILEISNHFNINMYSAEIIYSRYGFDLEKIRKEIFSEVLDPDFDKIYSIEVVYEIIGLLKNSQRILICSDYDADGLTSLMIFREILKRLNIDISKILYLVNERKEGYGLNDKIKKAVSSYNIDLLITMDLGSSDLDLIDYLLDLNKNLSIVIIDHHLFDKEKILELEEKYKDRFLFVNSSSDQRIHYYSAGSLVYRLFYRVVDLENLISIAAISAIADMCPLVKDNRLFVKKAFELNRWPRFLLRNGYSPRSIRDIAFSIAPKLNAVSRVGSVREFLKNLNNEYYLANYLDSNNMKRQIILSKLMKNIEKYLIISDKLVFCILPSEYIGLYGLIASRLAEKYKKPVFVGNINDKGTYNGSVRDFSKIPIKPILLNNKENLNIIHLDGHLRAYGFEISIEPKDFLKLVESIEYKLDISEPDLNELIDLNLDIEEVKNDIDQIKNISKELFPIGMGFSPIKIKINNPIDYIFEEKNRFYFIDKSFKIKNNQSIAEIMRNNSLILEIDDINSFNIKSEKEIIEEYSYDINFNAINKENHNNKEIKLKKKLFN